MRTIDKIIESKEAPKDKNVLWVNGDKLLTMVKGKWTPIGEGSSANAKNQDKSVDIVENGVTEVTADSGYTGLGKVTINANVQGGGASSGGGSSFEYFSVTDVEALSELVFLTSLIKLSYSGDVQILTSAILEDVLNGNASLLAIGIDMALPLIMDGATVTPREFFESMGITDLSAFGWTPITKEQFYNLEA